MAGITTICPWDATQALGRYGARHFDVLDYNLAMTIVIQNYNPAWPLEFEAIQISLAKVLGPLALRIDHIGSTSVPGLGAKDVIDVQITVQELTAEIRQRLVAAGYEHRGVHTHDHVPLGEDDDPSLWAKLVYIEPKGQRRANVHVRIAGNPNQRYALLFRDYLRSHPNSARSIELIKRELAKRHAKDLDAYYAIKDRVYDLIWDAALDWARQTGWKQGVIRYDLIEEPDLSEQGQASLRQLLAVSFPGYPDRTYYKQLPHQRILAWDGADLVGHLAIDKRVMALAGEAIRTLGLVDVCVAPGRRSQGIGSTLLAEAEKLGRRGRFQFAILFADDPRLYEANGYRYQQNSCVWLKIHEHQTLGIATEALPTALMVKPLRSELWRPGVLDLLGYLF